MTKFIKEFQWIDKKQGSVKNDIFSGLTVALALVPEAVAFAFVAGISPIIGLYGAFMMALITAIIGGRPGMISGATGAMAVVMVNLVHDANNYAETIGSSGPELALQFLFVTLIFTGGFQISSSFSIQVQRIVCLTLSRYIPIKPHQWLKDMKSGIHQQGLSR